MGNVNVGVVVSTYRRYDHLEEILTAWLHESDQVVLVNGGEWFKTSLPITQILVSPDPGANLRFVGVYFMTRNYVIFADDDLVPEAGLATDLHAGLIRSNHRCAGIMGRYFDNADYDRTTYFSADKIDKPVEVNFVGKCYIVQRDNVIGYDFIFTSGVFEDIDFQREWLERDLATVIPTTRYRDLFPECIDKQSISIDPVKRGERRACYTRYLQGAK